MGDQMLSLGSSRSSPRTSQLPRITSVRTESCSMSGLATFFRDFLPGDKVPDYNESIDVAKVVLPPKDETYYTDPWTLQEWRSKQKEVIANYFHRRIGVNEDLCEDTGDEYEDYHSDSDACASSSENEEESEDLLGTQQPLSPSSDPPQKQRQRRIPHVSQAIHSVRKLDYVDMFTSDLDLDVCEISRVWRLRDTKRGVWDDTRHKCTILDGRLPRLPFPFREEDGPAVPIYRNVVSFELVTKDKQRMFVFLYKNYAKLFDQWRMEQHANLLPKPKLLVQMKQIPAVCILPYTIDPKNWVDAHDLLDHCLCIGDESSMKVNTGDGRYEKVRMDSNSLELRFLYGSETTDETALELVLSEESLAGKVPQQQHGSLVAQWRQMEQLPIAPSVAAASSENCIVQANHTAGPGRPSTSPSDTVAPPFPTPAEPPIPEPLQVRPQRWPRPPLQTSPQAAPQRGTVRPRTVVLPEALPPIDSMTYEGSAKKRKISSETVEYISLSELRQALQVKKNNPSVSFNVYAAVVGFTCARQTTRGDWVATANLVDETLNEKPITIVMFCKERQGLPHLSQAGDILRMHRVFVGEWNGDIQLSGRKPSSYVVIRKPENDEWKVIPSATNSFVFSKHDEEKSQQLWHWAHHYVQQYATINEEHSFKIEDMSNETNDRVSDRDLTVMVCAKYPFSTEERRGTAVPCGFLRVWDGTGMGVSDPLPVNTVLARRTQAQGDPPPGALAKISSMLDKLRKSNERYGTLQTPKALCGKVANVVIWEETFWELVTQHVQVGCFVRLRNVDVCPWKDNNFASLRVHDKSWLNPLPEESIEIFWLLQAHNKRMRRNEFNPSSGVLPNSIPSTTSNTKSTKRSKQRLGAKLREFAESAEQSTFVGLVSLGDTLPKFENSLKAFCKQSSDGSSFVYQFAVALNDKSGKLDVIVKDSAGASIIGMSASVAVGTSSRRRTELFQPDQKWMAKVMRTNIDGVDYFVLVDISKA